MTRRSEAVAKALNHLKLSCPLSSLKDWTAKTVITKVRKEAKHYHLLNFTLLINNMYISNMLFTPEGECVRFPSNTNFAFGETL